MQTLSLQCCTERRVSIPANMSLMEHVAEDHELIKALVDWAEGGIAARVAQKIGVAASTINRHYNGTATTKLGRETLMKLRHTYPDFPKWDSGNHSVRSEVASFGDRPFDEKFGSGGLPAIPVVGSVIGMRSFDPERDIEMAEFDMAEVVDHVARPQSLSRDDQAYALTVVGDSMMPRFRPGRRVIVSPKAPVSIGDDVVVQLRGSTIQTAPTNPDPITLVLIKELVRRTASYIELRQFNPDVTFRIESERVAKIHKVIGEVY